MRSRRTWRTASAAALTAAALLSPALSACTGGLATASTPGGSTASAPAGDGAVATTGPSAASTATSTAPSTATSAGVPASVAASVTASVSAPAATSPSTSPSGSPAALEALRGKVIVIDPGHNGGNAKAPSVINKKVFVGNGTKACDTTGTATDAGYPEAAFTWDTANRLAAILRAAGARVVLTRSSNSGVGPCITERAAIGNRNHADVALSIHADGAPAAGKGFHVIAPARVGANAPIVAPSLRLATTVRDVFAARTGEPFSTYTGGGKALTVRSDLGGLNLSRVPKFFIECGNMRNASDAARLSSPAWRQKAAQALAEGIARYLAD